MSLEARVSISSDAMARLTVRWKDAVHSAAQKALVETAERIKWEGRASIAQAGFSDKWQNALRVDVYPSKSGGGSIYVRHNIPYAMVFEHGETIQGDPLLWLPLPSCPSVIGGRHPTPSVYQQNIGKLQYVRGRNHPLLVGKTATPPKAPPPPGVIRLSGPRVEKVSALRAGAKNGGYDVPMFFGVPSVTIAKKFDVLGVVERAYADLTKSFSAHLKEG
jgi:hypothetical protein